MPRRDNRKSIRLRGWDYREQGAYFVTICTYQRACILGVPAIVAALEASWRRAICAGQVPRVGEFVVMPNHVHGIVWLTGNRLDLQDTTVGARHPRHQTSFGNLAVFDVEGHSDSEGASPLRTTAASRPKGAPAGSLGALIGAFKSASAKRINTLRNTPGTPV